MEITSEELPNNQVTPSLQAQARSEPVAHMALASRFNVTDANEAENNKLAEIWAYASGMAKSGDIQDILWEVIHLENTLGAPRLGESRLDRLYRFAKLKRQEAEIQRNLQDVALTGRIRIG